MDAALFLREARTAYVAANAGALRWMLDRPRLHGAFLNTKQNSITLRDYGPEDGWRGPDVTYGWIQGRGLEAMATHAAFFEQEDPALAQRLDEAAQPLYRALAELLARDGHAAFAYDADMRPVYPDADGALRPQRQRPDIYTFSDIFVLKGLAAGAARYDRAGLDRPVTGLLDLARAIEDGRFVSDERQLLDGAALARDRGDYGPRMIMLGAAALLRQLGWADEARFGLRFVDHVLAGNLLPDGRLADKPGDDAFNPGHAIEFAGFALDLLGDEASPQLRETLERVFLAAFSAGFAAPGIRLRVSLATGEPLAPYFPWWSLPEAVRAAALAWERSRSPETLAAWRRASNAFFAFYWRGDPPLAYQTRTEDGPVDYVPATPDLDPGYHTGLSFLGAVRAIDRCLAAGL
ncbi:hypothetical protein NK718_12430 [Alsobacter sp. SYSU M60028]|uniref:N-acylglucosamine 2-epimerase n=1 Tax=Alsobacter ponti TaxID=2962936 RepID=A0ABT1LCU5_9HYPH|nr:hypothetical protein [Alsobacter ponti]MCP8939325.1 hypothetical protein [Alsobacter ponti]